ncbi:MAG TPA: radical SAM protein, partial [Treponemataceae bacterium]|nr:radical SAM protein [Treponemataceae bacterium]
MKDATSGGVQSVKEWKDNLIKQDEIDRYLVDGKDFIDDDAIETEIEKNRAASPERIRAIIKKAYDVNLMDSADVAALLNVTDPDLKEEIFTAAREIKHQVYDNRVVTFAPLYCGSKCVNRCKYCGFRCDNDSIERRVLTMDEIEAEARVLATKIGHKRLVVVYGEHPETDADYIAESMKRIYSIKERVRNGVGEIRRVNVNAAPLPIDDLKKLHEAGIGTFQVFQETYHHKTYREVHPEGTLKGNYPWRLYALHRAMDAGIDDVAVGALFGLYDWKFEVMGMVAHARDLEKRYGLGPHTVSVPRLEPASDTDFSWVKHRVSDDEFKFLIAVLRLAIPYA